MPAGDPTISVRSTHQLESRMREIRLSGSGEGAVLSRPYLIRSNLLMGFHLTVEVGNGEWSLRHDREATAGIEAIGDGL